ncbi:MAG: type I-PGING CRISPR-associated protein Cas7/Csp1 [Bacteroidetes bacterium]|nr:MAG: type I-PGING CRISPR-associated protein Cas7/Csp1 [Bacteroidota bacterium]
MTFITSILITQVAPMELHAANRGEKLLGNASSVKRLPDGRVYISGQMQRHVLFSAMDRLNEQDPQKGDTYVANGDGVSTDIAKDLKSDLGGFLVTDKGYSGRRMAPLTATMAVARHSSEVGRDLLVRLKLNPNADSEQKQALATNEFSQRDEMLMSFHLDVGRVGVQREFQYEDEKHIGTHYVKHIDDGEHRRRVRLFLQAAQAMNDYANQARNAISGEPNRVLIVLDNRMSRKAVRYFSPQTTEAERASMLRELETRGARYFLGDDTTEEGLSVEQAYSQALQAIAEGQLYRPQSMNNN